MTQTYDPYHLASPAVYLVKIVIFLVLVGLVAAILITNIISFFWANPFINSMIFFALFVGIFLSFRQIFRLFPEVKWVNSLQDGNASNVRPPVLLAPVAGILKKILKNEGDEAAPGDVIAMIEEGGADGDGKKAKKADAAKSSKDGAAPAKEASKTEKKSEPKAGAGQAKEKEPAKADAKAEAKAEPKQTGDAPDEEKDLPQAASRAHVMPSARRSMSQKGLTAADVKGTGPGGRILKEDVESHAAQQEEAGQEVDGGPDTHAERLRR